MTSRGFLIRFIDIGLIVLFGFVMISDIENSSQVELSAVTDQQSEEDTEVERAFVTVGIAPNGVFSVFDSESDSLLAAGITRSEALAAVLRQIKQDRAAENKEVIVLIRPHEDSVVQRTVDVMDICDRLALGKSLQDLELREEPV